MERGKAGQYKGKSLDEINLNLEEDLIQQPEDITDEAMEPTEVAMDDNKSFVEGTADPNTDILKDKTKKTPTQKR